MAVFVLVHGSFHGPWCWSRIVPLLQAAGHETRLADLALAKGVPDLAAYAQHVCDLIDAPPEGYIQASHDQAVAPAYQAAMVRRSPCAPVMTLPSDHSPFLSMPDQLAAALLPLA
jgi:hypothetical protein